MSKRQKTYSDGISESIEILHALKDIDERENNAYFLVKQHIEDKDKYYDKVGTKIKEGDFLMMNPDDDDWLDFVIRYGGNLILVSELTGGEIKLSECLQGSDNPSVIVGNLHNNRIEFFKW